MHKGGGTVPTRGEKAANPFARIDTPTVMEFARDVQTAVERMPGAEG